MKIALIVYPGVSLQEWASFYESLSRLASQERFNGLSLEVCVFSKLQASGERFPLVVDACGATLGEYDAIVLTGGDGAETALNAPGFADWLKSGRQGSFYAANESSATLWAAAGISAYTPPVGKNPGAWLAERLAGDNAEPFLQQDEGESQNEPSGRRAAVSRKTHETSIEMQLNLDGRGQSEIASGLAFLDHMLHNFALHGLLDLQLKAAGDLQVDAHHTVEDIALALGKAVDQSLGNRSGIARSGSAYYPMDETLAFVALDFSGRPYAVVQVEWRTPVVGGIDTSLFEHFLESFAAAARCNLHARVLYGRDDHHKAEALFKAFGRALEAAVRVEPRRGSSIPSTKGTVSD